MNSSQFATIGLREVVGLFFQAYEGAVGRSWVGQVATTFPSSSAVEKYGGIGNAPALREWVGGRLAKSLNEFSMLVENKDYEATLEIFRKDLTRDKTLQLMPKINGLATRAAEHSEKLLSALIDVAESTNSYDGQYFFDTDHSIGASGTLDNDLTASASTATAPTAAEMALAILKGIQGIYKLKDDQGEPTNSNLKTFIVMVPPTFWAAAMQAVSMQIIQGTGGPLQNPTLASGLNLQLVNNPRLTWTTKFAIFGVDGATKPFLIQEEDPITMEVLGEGSDHAFKTGAYLYGVRKAGAAAYWDFTKAAIVTLS